MDRGICRGVPGYPDKILSILEAGKGGQGCRCSVSSWTNRICTWTYYRVIDGQKRSGWVSDENTDCTNTVNPPTYNPYVDGTWELGSQNYRSFSCTNGRAGADGTSGSQARDGSYGWVVINLGFDSKTKLTPTLTGRVADVVGHTYLLTGNDSEQRSGLRSLLAPGSNVSEHFLLRKYMQRKLPIDWKAQISPRDPSLSQFTLQAQLSGTAANPTVHLNVPSRLVKKVTELPEGTIVTITRVLNTDDAGTIAACTKYNRQGSALCELSGRCTYYPNEGGDCLPK